MAAGTVPCRSGRSAAAASTERALLWAPKGGLRHGLGISAQPGTGRAHAMSDCSVINEVTHCQSLRRPRPCQRRPTQARAPRGALQAATGRIAAWVGSPARPQALPHHASRNRQRLPPCMRAPGSGVPRRPPAPCAPRSARHARPRTRRQKGLRCRIGPSGYLEPKWLRYLLCLPHAYPSFVPGAPPAKGLASRQLGAVLLWLRVCDCSPVRRN